MREKIQRLKSLFHAKRKTKSVLQVIQQGAEAILIKKGNDLLKRRVVKGYRYPELDNAIRRRRTRREVKLLTKAAKLIDVPKVIEASESEIEMEFIDGLKLSESLDDLKNWEEVCLTIGKNIAKLHDADIIHGDLTTSNMIWAGGKLDSASLVDGAHSVRKLSQKPTVVLRDDNVKGGSGKLYFIDFGLGFSNGRVEDKAVDLHLIKQALEAKHFEHFEKFFKSVLKGYEKSENYDKVMERLRKVEKRGRYKEQY